MNRHNCTIIIDTNQFCGDYMLSGMRWKQLVSYLSKTDATLQMPSIVWEEIKRNYTKKLSELHTHAITAVERLNHHTVFRAPHFSYWGDRYEVSPLNRIHSVDELVDRYLSYVKDTLNLKSKDFLLWDSNWFEELIERAINHVKPFGEDSDKGFKDSLLWKTVLALEKRPGFKDGPIVLISSNSKDFGNTSEKGKIHPVLAAEARQLGLDLYYFDNLDVFLEKWAADALAINLDRMREIVSERMLKVALRNSVSFWLRRNEPAESNIFLSGTNFKIESEIQGRLVIRVSISGYLTNTWTSCEYLDFNAEAIYREELQEQIVVEEFCVPSRDKWTKGLETGS